MIAKVAAKDAAKVNLRSLSEFSDIDRSIDRSNEAVRRRAALIVTRGFRERAKSISGRCGVRDPRE
jgi:hypothetical protein